jgi:hypothetical protein
MPAQADFKTADDLMLRAVERQRRDGCSADGRDANKANA